MDGFDKKTLRERDIWTKYIASAIVFSGWYKYTQFREEVGSTAGRVVVRGQHGHEMIAEAGSLHAPRRAEHRHRRDRGQGQQALRGGRGDTVIQMRTLGY